MIPLIAIRPEPGCAATVAAARERGLNAMGFPMWTIQPRAWEPVDPSEIDALLIGSANALRHGGPGLERLSGMAAHVVGQTTAEAARAAGLMVASTGSGGLQSVLDAIPPGTRLLRLAGAERITLTPPPGVTITERVCYASESQPMPPQLVRLLSRPALVLLHSAEAARHFAQECDRLGIDRADVSFAALGPRIADAAGQGWALMAVAETPDDAALLATAEKLCQNVPKPDA
ncbi:MAG: uroporphyrinogen-III synthase [Novosphingobium sp.]